MHVNQPIVSTENKAIPGFAVYVSFPALRIRWTGRGSDAPCVVNIKIRPSARCQICAMTVMDNFKIEKRGKSEIRNVGEGSRTVALYLAGVKMADNYTIRYASEVVPLYIQPCSTLNTGISLLERDACR